MNPMNHEIGISSLYVLTSMEQKKYGKNLNIIKKVEIADMNMDKQTIHGVISLPRRQMIASNI